MSMLMLIESACGYGLLNLKKDVLDVITGLDEKEPLENLINVECFAPFKNQKDAVKDTHTMQSGNVPKHLKKLLKKLKVVSLGEKLVVTNNKLGQELNKSLGLSVICNANTIKLNKKVMEHFSTLTTITRKEQVNMSLAVAHGLNRYNLKCNPEKVDTMVVQAQSLLEDLDKESNNYVMRCKEIYGWHFPELSKLVENNEYIQFVDKVGDRNNCLSMDLSQILSENVVEKVQRAARISCGATLTERDSQLVASFCKLIISMTERRDQVFTYLKKRMQAIAPNLSCVCGETLGAKLIAHAGTLRSLAKLPSSTIQIIGAEKALFKAIKQKDCKTPKFGYMYHASLVQKSGDKLKGSAARLLANGAALCARKDAFDEIEYTEDQAPNIELGEKILTKIKRGLDSKTSRSVSAPKKPRLDANINSIKSGFNRNIGPK